MPFRGERGVVSRVRLPLPCTPRIWLVILTLAVTRSLALAAADAPFTTVVQGANVAAEDVLDARDATAPDGVLRVASRLPGTMMRDGGGVGQRRYLSLRGTDPSGTLVLLDGVPLNSPFSGGADLGGMDLVPLQSLVITRGGLSDRHGSAAVGGVVDARLRCPLTAPFSDLSLTLGSFGTARLKALHAMRGEHVAGLASMGIQSSSGNFPYRDSRGQSGTRRHNGVAGIEGLVKVVVPAGRFGQFETFVEAAQDDREIAGLEQFPSDSARQRDRRVLASVLFLGAPSLGGHSWSAQAYLRHFSFAFDDAHPPMGPALSSRLAMLGGGGSVEASLAVASFVSVFAGLQAAFDQGWTHRLETPDQAASRWVVAALTGSRLDTGVIRAEATLRAEHDGGFGWQVLPRLALVARIAPPIEVFARASRAFRLPTLEELHFMGGFVQGNPDLDPERAWTWDAGVLTHPLPGLRLSAAFFEIRPDNLIVFLPRSAFVTRAENSGGALLRGVESSLAWHWNGVRASLSYTFQTARFASGMSLPGRPRHRAAMDVGWEIGPVGLNAALQAGSGFFLDRFEALHEEARVMLDARITLRPHSAVTLALDVMNVLDKRDAVDFMQYPIPGRAFFATVRVAN